MENINEDAIKLYEREWRIQNKIIIVDTRKDIQYKCYKYAKIKRQKKKNAGAFDWQQWNNDDKVGSIFV